MRPACGIALLLALLTGCIGSQFNLATQREEYSVTSDAKEAEMGRRIARKVAEELPQTADTAMQARVRAIGERLVAVCDRQDLVYSFTAVDEERVNAFSLPGGYVFVHADLVKKAASDDELAGVLAHEIAHITARHAVKRYESGLGAQLAGLVALAARQGRAAQGVSLALQAAQLAYARQDELEADRLGVKYMQAAGFNPRGMLTFLEKLRQEERKDRLFLPRGVVRPQYARTHPFVPERIRAVKEALFGVADYVDYLNSRD